MADRLTLARALEGGGIGRDAAEHIATEIINSIRENVATKSDLQALRSDLQASEAALRSDLQASEAALRSDLQAGEAALRAEIGGLRAELRNEVAGLRAELALVEHRLLTRVGSTVVVATGILVAIHYIH